MGAYIKHFLTVYKHRKIVRHECAACGLWFRGVLHDLSKYSMVEFFSSAKYFQGDKSPIDVEKAAVGYSAAWMHHKGHNPHHWEYWVDFDTNGDAVPAQIPVKYVVEMVCDWIGAGKVYSHGEWKNSAPLDYYNKVRAGRHFHPKTEMLLIGLLKIIRDEGLEAFHSASKKLLKSGEYTLN